MSCGLVAVVSSIAVGEGVQGLEVERKGPGHPMACQVGGSGRGPTEGQCRVRVRRGH